jgi:hypothetical protein
MWPRNGSQFVVDNNLSKVRVVPPGLENGTDITLPFGGEVDIGDETVGKGEPMAVATEVGHT